jgi:phage gp46-like protein
MPRDIFYDLRYSFVGQDWTENVVKDVEIISNEDCIVQIILLRLLIPKGQYKLNPRIGSDLYLLAQAKSTSVTERQIRRVIDDALRPEVEAGNIGETRVTIERTENDRIKVKLEADIIDGNPVNLNLLIGT